MGAAAGFHLHFYQPPRENPWLGLPSREVSAWPFHDWNERITAECYRAMVAVELTGGDGAPELYEPLGRSSVDVGPTLQHWLDRYAPDVGDALTDQVTSAPGGAPDLVLAAPLVHAILPLARPEDQSRLVAWGIADYQHRYGVAPRGMWLPETAVDLATLAVLADQGIEFTVLMANQARRVRAPGGAWVPVDEASLDTSRAYRVTLDDGASITVVFGQPDLSRRVAFGGLIADGVHLADVMADAARASDGMVLVVADGETYGHHHHFGDLGMCWALRRLEREHGLATSLGTWLRGETPTWEVELAAVSAWSCAHGVERWRSDCGCVTGEQPGWSLDWRAPLREALDWLRATLGPRIDEALASRVRSPDAALADYGRVIAGTVLPAAFVVEHAVEPPDDAATEWVLELCEAYRNVLYSFTSCAWFFADPGEIETAIVLRYAAIAIDAVRRLLGEDVEAAFVERLAPVRSTNHGIAGEAIWRRAVDLARTTDERVGAAAAAEFATCGLAARTSRGHYDLAVARDDDVLVVTTTHRPTTRRRTVEFRVRRTGPFDWRVTYGNGREGVFTTADFGEDVVARLAMSALGGEGSVDVDQALSQLAAQLLARPATPEDERALVALAGAARVVSPIGQAAVRRALLATLATRESKGWGEELVGLATVLDGGPVGG